MVRLLLDGGADMHAVDEVLETLNYRQANCCFSPSTKSTLSPRSHNFGELYLLFIITVWSKEGVTINTILKITGYDLLMNIHEEKSVLYLQTAILQGLQ